MSLCVIVCHCVAGGQLIQRCVIIQRDEKGYGLTVSGDNPVFVQSVKESMFSVHFRFPMQTIAAPVVVEKLSVSFSYTS